MKTSHIIIGVLSIIIVLFLVLIYKTNRDKRDLKEAKRLKADALSSGTTTSVVHPATGEEVIISPTGFNMTDQGTGTILMESSIAKIIQETVNSTGSQPESITLKTYSKTGQLLGTTIINNPKAMEKPVAQVPEQNMVNGTISYSCSKEQELDGPGYYSDYSGRTLFGMFCK